MLSVQCPGGGGLTRTVFLLQSCGALACQHSWPPAPGDERVPLCELHVLLALVRQLESVVGGGGGGGTFVGFRKAVGNVLTVWVHTLPQCTGKAFSVYACIWL